MPVGAAPTELARRTCTLTVDSWPWVTGSGVWVAVTVAASLQIDSRMLSTYQPSTPPQPSRPTSNRIWTVSPGSTPAAARSSWEVPHEPRLSPPSMPLQASSPCIGLVLPAPMVSRSLFGALKM